MGIMTAILSELRHAVRSLGRIPGTAAVSIATLGFGIAAATTTFTAVYAALLRPIPFADPDGLLYLHTTRQTPAAGTVLLRWSAAEADTIRRGARSFASAATYTRTSIGISGEGNAAQVDAEVVSSSYFETLEVAPVVGRTFSPEEEEPGHAVAVIGDGLWRRRFAADPAVAGRTIVVNGVALTIIGVMPPGFAGVTGHAVLWIPRGMAPVLTYREYLTTPQHFMNLIARLAPGATLDQARAELATLGAALPVVVDPSAPPARWSATAIPLDEARIDPTQRRGLLLLLGGAACLLLVACLNVMLLLLTRAQSRLGEMAVRLALGASRWRVARQLLAESGVIAVSGSAVGVLLASWGIAWLRRGAPEIVPSAQNNYGQIAQFAAPALDVHVLVVVAALAGAVTLLSGAAPALSASRGNPAQALAGASRAVSGPRSRLLSALVVIQIGLAILLLSGARLLARTVTALEADRSGFDGRAITFWINPPASRYADAAGPAIVERLLSRIQQMPGVERASVNRCTPYTASCARTLLFRAGHPSVPSDAPVVGRHYVSRDYFGALGIALHRGRLLSDADRSGRPAVTVINETAARRFWPGEDPIGKRVWFGGGTGFDDPEHPVEIVGIVADVKYWPLTEPVGPDFYTSYLQFTYPSSLYVVRSALGAGILPAIRGAVAEIDPTLPLYDVQLMDGRVAEAVARPRFTATVTGIFALSAGVLAAMGVFGVMAYSVSMQRGELALRLALGDSPRGLLLRTLRRAARLTTAGVAAGLLVGVWLLRILQGSLYGVSANDPATLLQAVACMSAVAMAAAALPAWRAGATDPMTSLRR